MKLTTFSLGPQARFSAISLAILLALGVSHSVRAQVGVGTFSPQATLDVVGEPASAGVADGVIVPRITGDQLAAKTAYGAPQNSALVYVEAAASAPAGTTINVVAPGFYYWDAAANVWVGITTTSNGKDLMATDASILVTNGLGATIVDAGIQVADKGITPDKIENGAPNQVLSTNAAGDAVEWKTIIETLTTLGLNADNTNLDYTDEAGVTNQINLTDAVKNLETLTTLVDNANGTLTYTDEAGTAFVIDKANLTDNGDGSYTFTNNDGSDVTFSVGGVADITDDNTALNINPIATITKSDGTVVLLKETVTTIVDNGDGTFTYTNELGNPISISIDDADADATNELNTGFAINGTDLELTDAGGTLAVPLSAIGSDDQDLTGA
ncbi:hypothetical protein GCU85_05570, partial [Cardiobacteriales bacterium ML27]